MADASAIKNLGQPWSNEVQLVKLTYDFANDGGAQSTISLANVNEKIMVLNGVVQVETQCTSAGSATVQIGSSSGDVDAWLTVANGAVANLTDDATFKQDAGQALVVSATETIDLVIGTADLTAGKINLYLEYVKAA